VRPGPTLEALGCAAVVTALVTAASWLPDRWVTSAVCFVFLGATWLFVWRGDDDGVVRAGLDFGGIVLPGALDRARVVRAVLSAVAWAAAMGLVFFVPFWIGFRAYWQVKRPFSLELSPLGIANLAFGQLVLVALPEEAFYRGYVQSRLDEAWAPRWKVFGARVGPSLLVTSAVFALGHLATVHLPARLAVFFPSLAFGWLRERTRGVGAAIVFHAACNVFSEVLGRGYGLF
jgi:membrane protease YdiL (CAAX protease family)